jgi:hypothetical protein
VMVAWDAYQSKVLAYVVTGSMGSGVTSAMSRCMEWGSWVGTGSQYTVSINFFLIWIID